MFGRDLRRFSRELLCGRPVPDNFPEEFGTLEPEQAFGGVHSPFRGSRVEHVFQMHGNYDVGGIGIDPPPGAEFISCAGRLPCFIDSWRLMVVGPSRPGRT